MKLKNPKAKGDAFERRIVEILREYGFEARRSPMSGAIKGIGLEPDVLSKPFPFFISCKDVEKANMVAYWHEADRESGAKPPIVAYTKNRENIYCFLLFSDLLNLMTKGFIMKEKIKKPEKSKRVSLEGSSRLKFSKLHQVRRKKKSS